MCNTVLAPTAHATTLIGHLLFININLLTIFPELHYDDAQQYHLTTETLILLLLHLYLIAPLLSGSIAPWAPKNVIKCFIVVLTTLYLFLDFTTAFALKLAPWSIIFNIRIFAIYLLILIQLLQIYVLCYKRWLIFW